ncbi:MAG: hypothetical protein ACSLFB_12510 [Acidimicrobiales bacterium]
MTNVTALQAKFVSSPGRPHRPLLVRQERGFPLLALMDGAGRAPWLASWARRSTTLA